MFEEFSTAAANRKKLVTNDTNLRQAFNDLDKDNDGFISKEEFKNQYGFES